MSTPRGRSARQPQIWALWAAVLWATTSWAFDLDTDLIDHLELDGDERLTKALLFRLQWLPFARA